jgi:hypothetical protein
MHSRSLGCLSLTLAFHADRIDDAKAEEARRCAEARPRKMLSAEEVASVNAWLAVPDPSCRSSGGSAGGVG